MPQLTRALSALFACIALAPAIAFAQQPDDAEADTTTSETEEPTRPDFNADAVYERPFIANFASTSVGGYVEGNFDYGLEDGIPEGPSFELRRFNLFVFSSIAPRLRFLSELEFEHGTEEIALETAQLDYELYTALQIRFGILLPPIGAFNQNHDAPVWEFVERPLVSTTILPATLSEPGGGVHGKFFFGGMGLSYELYVTNGLGPGIVSNEEGRTSIPAGKREGIFEEDNNPVPAVSGRTALRHFDVGELGVSAYWSRYNDFASEGEPIDTPRSVTMLAVDYQTDFTEYFETRGEAAYAFVEVPPGAGDENGTRQFGVHVDLIGHVWRPRLFGEEPGELNANLRLEYVDYNIGTFESTGEPIGDEVYALVPGVSFRPVPQAVFRLNFRREWHIDLPHNAPAHRGVFQFGVATYF